MDNIVLYYFVVVQTVAPYILTDTGLASPQLLGTNSTIANNVFGTAEKAFFAYLNL